MKASWLIEDFTGDSSFERVQASVKRLGLRCEVVRYVPFAKKVHGQLFPEGSCVVPWGSINLLRQLGRKAPWWAPGLEWCSWDRYRCMIYYAHWGEFLFNGDYRVMPLAEVKRRQDEILAAFPEGFFMRPDGGDKSFPGRVINPFDLSKKRRQGTWDGIERGTASAETLVIVAPARNCVREWRVVMVGAEPIAASRYFEQRRLKPETGAPSEVLDFAAKVGRVWGPDPVYVLDVVQEASGRLSVMECGSFSLAGLYAIDTDVVVERLSAEAKKSWREASGE